MPSLDEYKALYPEIWEEVLYDELLFINSLQRYEIIDSAEWSDLLEVVARRQLIDIPEEEKVETLRERMGLALFNRTSDFFSLLFKDVWFTLLTQLDKIYEILITLWDRTIGTWVNGYVDMFLTWLKPQPGDPPIVVDALNRLNKRVSLFAVATLVIYRVAYILGMVWSLLPIISKDAGRALNKDYSPALPDISTLVTLYYKNPGDRAAVYNKAAEQGFDKREVDIYINSMEALLSPDDLKNLYLRGKIDDDTLSYELQRSGWNPKNILRLKELFYVIPGPSDQIRFAVREAFDDEYIRAFDTMKDFPKGFAEQAKKVGVDQYWAEKYWAAHWELPPLAAAYEMLHRDVIEPEHLDQLFKAQDVMPWWREKLKAISYNPLTRVDVRRMYKTGTLDREGVHRAYLDVGYNDKNATLMTDFTIKWVAEKERDLTKADILGAYQRKLISPEDTRDGLQGMGYDPDETEILISRIDYELAKKKKASVLRNLEKGYKKGAYDVNHIQARMQEMNMAGTEITELVNLWNAENKDDVTPLGKADITAMFKGKIITEANYKERLTSLNYTAADIELLVKLNK